MSATVPTAIGRYQILRTLGEGGMGAVYLARDPAIDRHVAIKLMRTGFDDGQLRERFAREARSIGRLHHPNIVTIFDVGDHNGEPFIAMEYVEGQTLGHIVRHPGTGSLLDRVGWMDGVCAGLQYAHRAGIIHRDIKPANVMVETDGAVKILDFGIARGTTPGVTHAATQAGVILGTLNYMSPEQLSGRPVDHRTDIFSAGAVFYELFAGRMAFPGDIQTGVLHLILQSGPEPLATVCPTLDPGIVSIVNRCLERDPDTRYGDLGATRRDLAAVLRRLEAGDQPAPTVIVTPRAPAGDAEPRTPRVPSSDARAELLKLRQERISQELTEARAALGREDLTGAMEGCRQALIIDPENDGALALQDQIEAARQARDWLIQAQTELERGELTSASRLADQVLGVLPASAKAQAVRRGIEEARRRLEEIERRARALEAALADGRALLAAGQLDEALASAAKAASIDPTQPELASLRARIAAEQRRRAEEEARLKAEAEAKRRADEEARRRAENEARAQQIIARAQRVVADAQQRFAAGDHEGALTILRAHQPPHALVAEAIASLEGQLGEMARRAEDARKAEARRKEEELRQQQEVERQAVEARRKAEDERRRVAEEQKKAEADERRRFKAAEKAREQAEEDERRRRHAADTAAREQAEREKRAAQAAADLAAAEAKAAREAEARAAREAEAKAAREAAAKAARDAEARRAAAAASSATEEKTAVLTSAAVSAAAAESTLVVGPTARPMSARAVDADRPADATQPAGRSRVLIGAGLAALVVVGLIGWLVTRGGSTPPSSTSVLLDVRPWANIEQIVRRSDGQPVTLGPLTTPCVVSLPPGEYHVRAKNPYFDSPLEFDITVGTDGFQEVHQALPDLRPDAEAAKLLGLGTGSGG